MKAKVTTTTTKLPLFRLCVFGHNAKGQLVRRMKSVPAADYDRAAEAMAKYGPELAKGLEPTFAQIAAPLV